MCFSHINLIQADLARERHDLDTARQFLDAAHEWALARDAKETLCWAARVRARIARDAEAPDDARRAVEEGLRIARDCGFGIYHIDLLLLRARLALEAGDAEAALADIDTALSEGVHPPEESGLPELLAATDPECGYAWGEAEGRHLRAEALLHRAARQLERNEFAPARFGQLPEEVRGLLDAARQELETCRALRQKIQDPKVEETQRVLADLDGGVLTRVPLVAATANEVVGGANEQTLEPEENAGDEAEDLEGPIDVAIIVALEEEFEELQALAPPWTAIKDPATGGYDYLFRHPVDGAVPYRCAATFVGETGPEDTALAVDRFLNRRKPRTIVMLGIAAGIHDDVKLGDVVVANSVGRYLKDAKVVDGATAETFEIRPGGDAFPPSPDLVKATQHLKFARPSVYKKWQEVGQKHLAESIPAHKALQKKNWLGTAPVYVAGTLASGPVVAAAKSFLDWVRSIHRKYLALEMESGGMLAAVYSRADPTRSLVLRGISDFGDDRKKDLDAIGGGGLRRYAMGNTVRLLWGLLEAGELPRADGS